MKVLTLLYVNFIIWFSFLAIKPFIEVSIVQLLMKNSQIRQFKYFKVLVQEFHIKMDIGFVNALVEMFSEQEVTPEKLVWKNVSYFKYTI